MSSLTVANMQVYVCVSDSAVPLQGPSPLSTLLGGAQTQMDADCVIYFSLQWMQTIYIHYTIGQGQYSSLF